MNGGAAPGVPSPAPSTGIPSGGSAPAGAATGPAAVAAPDEPVLSKLKVSPKSFHRGSVLAKVSISRPATRITFTLSEAANVKLSFAKAERRRRVVRHVTVGSFTVRGRSGPNAVAFAGRLSRTKRLPLGSYKLTATPTDSAGNTGRPRTATLRIVGG
jgi:hypothetical protein